MEVAVVQLHDLRRAPVAKVRGAAALAPADDQAVVERDRDGRVPRQVALHLRTRAATACRGLSAW